MIKKIAVTIIASASLVLGLSSRSLEAANVSEVESHSTVGNFNINRSQQNWMTNLFHSLTDKLEKENTNQPVENQKPAKEIEQPQTPEQEVEQNDNQEQTETPTESVETPKTEDPVEPTEEVNSSLNAFEQQVVELTNQERAKQGLQPLSIDQSLSEIAREKSNDMAKNGYFSHNSPTYGSPFDMMQQFGVSYRTAGENIARGQRSPEEVVNGWMNSEGHRANILNPNFTHIGVGYVEGSNHWTQMFIGK